MKAQFIREYISTGKFNPRTKGQPRYSYAVIGTAEEIKDFEKSQGKFLVKDENGTPILNLTQYFGPTVELIKRRADGRWVPAKGRLEIAHDLAKKYPLFADKIAEKAISAYVNFGFAGAEQDEPTAVMVAQANLSE